ncbi:hypothetical protein cyc_04588 [Cyclospora cayetanensis]|uniref:Uncharacterized protein n=1 Tax=Cyclospora cayetanensis TaxID=88456 RepID=A0A1D3CS26_9EIME|nr:hypothetical protein cyc_04588 [Cyclospora cayetanensis]
MTEGFAFACIPGSFTAAGSQAAPPASAVDSASYFFSFEAFDTGSVPLCECTGIKVKEFQSGGQCDLGFSVGFSKFCFIPPSHCATVNPMESATVPADAWWGAAKTGEERSNIEKVAKLLEQAPQPAQAPACHCWTLGDFMVAPCAHQGYSRGGNSPPRFVASLEDLSLESLWEAHDGILHAERQASEVQDAIQPPSRMQANGAATNHLQKDQTHELGRELQSPWAPQQQQHFRERKLLRQEGVEVAANGGGGKGGSSSGDAAFAAAAGEGGPHCHRSCAGCLDSGRDRCLSCVNQLPYPYIPPPTPQLPLDSAGAREEAPDSGGPPLAPAPQYHALVAVHQDGSGYCIPLAFASDASADPGDACMRPSSACTTADGEGSGWNGYFDWLSTANAANSSRHTRDRHCHPSCAVCRADCCTEKSDNCLSCKGKRWAFHPIYRDGTGHCVDLRPLESQEDLVPREGEEETAEAVQGASAGVFEKEHSLGVQSPETSTFAAIFQSVLSSIFSVPNVSDAANAAEHASSPKAGSSRKGPSFLPDRSVCEFLPRKIQDLPLRAWSQLVFVHADNNLEESALLDMEEMLHPWRGEIVNRQARTAARGPGTSSFPVGGSALPGSVGQEALEDLYLVVLIDRSNQSTTTDMNTVHACPELEYSSLGEGVKQLPGSSEVELSAQMAFELLRIHLRNGRREWLLLRSLGEVDMNDPSVLENAVTRLLDIFPSRHYAAILWNHGSAWVGFGDDDSNPNSQPMSIHEIALGLKNGIASSKLGKVDRSFRLSLLGFDACLMGSYDVLETLAPLTHFFIASEDNEPGHGWNYRHVICTDLPRLCTPWSFMVLCVIMNASSYAQSGFGRMHNANVYNCKCREPVVPSMDPTTLTRKPPPPYRVATAFEYGTRFVTSYGLHPPSSNALTLALIETFSIRGCRMLGLCSCYDLNDFLANLLQQFASDQSELGRTDVQPYMHEHEARGVQSASAMEALLRFPGTDGPQPTQPGLHTYTIDSIGAARRALTEKVIAARVLFRKMIVAEVGSREPGRYGGLSIYFPDPNMAVTCKAQRSAASWARRYTHLIRTKFSSFVVSVLSNRKGSVCYAPWGSAGEPGSSFPSSLPEADSEAEQWFGILCSRLVQPFSNEHSDAAVGISAVLPSTVVSALMFRGFATEAAIPGGGKKATEIIVTSTVQATMTDAEVKGPLAFAHAATPSAESQGGGSNAASTSPPSSTAQPSPAAKLRNFTVVQGWWSSHVWTLRQQLHLDDPLKDPRLESSHASRSGNPETSTMEALLVALQDGLASSRAGSGKETTFSFPFLFFANAVEAECLEDGVLHTEDLRGGQSALGRRGAPSGGIAGEFSSVLPTRKLQAVEDKAAASDSVFFSVASDAAHVGGRRVLSSTVLLPLRETTESFENDLGDGFRPASSAAAATELGLLNSLAHTARRLTEPPDEAQREARLPGTASPARRLFTARAGTSPWLLHERLGPQPKRPRDVNSQCGMRAFLLTEWNSKTNAASEPVLYVIKNEVATEWPRAHGGLLLPIQHRLRKLSVPQQAFQRGHSQAHAQEKSEFMAAQNGEQADPSIYFRSRNSDRAKTPPEQGSDSLQGEEGQGIRAANSSQRQH